MFQVKQGQFEYFLIALWCFDVINYFAFKGKACKANEVLYESKCYFISKDAITASWYEARSMCLIKKMDLITLSSNQALADFLQIIHSHNILTVFLGATKNSQDFAFDKRLLQQRSESHSLLNTRKVIFNYFFKISLS